MDAQLRQNQIECFRSTQKTVMEADCSPSALTLSHIIVCLGTTTAAPPMRVPIQTQNNSLQVHCTISSFAKSKTETKTKTETQ